MRIDANCNKIADSEASNVIKQKKLCANSVSQANMQERSRRRRVSNYLVPLLRSLMILCNDSLSDMNVLLTLVNKLTLSYSLTLMTYHHTAIQEKGTWNSLVTVIREITAVSCDRQVHDTWIMFLMIFWQF